MSLHQTNLATAQGILLTPYGLHVEDLNRVFAEISAHRADDADIYFQYTRSEGWSLEEGIVKAGSFNIDQGVGIRTVIGDKTAFAYSDNIHMDALLNAARVTRDIAPSRSNRGVKAKTTNLTHALKPYARDLYYANDPITTIITTKINI